ncbi:2-oxoglutaramate amidase (plasmid) [Aquicella lusitana]|uniref:Putative amidohydrolase n=2 Tax=Aquicella lusitana TaxID=254246 RepID=A0A370G5Y0_9COXI|nr:putative amidohydrolase [Aquicella lusitana]VVC74599.1 2-oxoglutaramate amidase [Aquicella lusitana]
MIRIACSQYQIEELPDWERYVVKIEKLVMDAKKDEANILLMPEYSGIEIACKKFNTDGELFEALQPLIPKYIELYQKLAQTYEIYIQAGTIIEKIKSGQFINRAYIFSPNGAYEYQDKLQLTEYEKSIHLLQHGDKQKIFETSLGKIGIAVCYDSEFPEIIRSLVQHGASIILVPSYTTTLAGYNRVFLSCRARAIENQCHVAISFVINEVNLSGEFDHAYGQAAILGPADIGFPDDGIIVQGQMNQPMLVTGKFSLEALTLVRKEGQVHNFEDSVRFTQINKEEMRFVLF